MKQKRDQRTLIIVSLLVIVLIMVVGFAAFATNLTINGTANISTNWCVGFDNTKTSAYEITKGKSTGTNPSATMGYEGTACSSTYVPIANLGAVFYQPGDKIEYTLTIANKGSVDAAIESITVDGTSVTSNQTITKGNIIWKIYMPEDVVLSASTGTTTMVVSAEFQNTTDLSNYTLHESQTIAIGVNAVQGTSGMDITPAAQTVYAINTDSIYKENTNSIYKDSSSLEAVGTTYSSCSATGKTSCLKYTIENNKVTGAEACFIKGGSEYCLTGWVDECLYDENDNCTFTGTPTVFNSNKSVLQSAFTESNACDDDGSYFYCDASGVYAQAESDGSVSASDDSWRCGVSSDGHARCSDAGGK